jgi:hypothetical protein
MTASPDRFARGPEFELFASYAHRDNKGNHSGKVNALVDAIRQVNVAATGRPLDC